MKVIFVGLILILGACNIDGLRCYTCSVGENDLDKRCITDPDNVEFGSAITNCNKSHCVSIRQEYKDKKNAVASMSRSCMDNPPFTNQIIEDATYRFYYTTCQKDLCNGGTGKDTSGSGGIVADPNSHGNLLVKGVGNDAGFVSPSLMLFAAVYMTMALV